MEKISLIPKKSYENFILGDDITNYLHLPYHMKSSDDPIVYDVYYFDNLNFDIWVENDKIVVINCEIECYWQGKNLIGMLYDDFLALINYPPGRTRFLPCPAVDNLSKLKNHMRILFLEMTSLITYIYRII